MNAAPTHTRSIRARRRNSPRNQNERTAPHARRGTCQDTVSKVRRRVKAFLAARQFMAAFDVAKFQECVLIDQIPPQFSIIYIFRSAKRFTQKYNQRLRCGHGNGPRAIEKMSIAGPFSSKSLTALRAAVGLAFRFARPAVPRGVAFRSDAVGVTRKKLRQSALKRKD